MPVQQTDVRDRKADMKPVEYFVISCTYARDREYAETKMHRKRRDAGILHDDKTIVSIFEYCEDSDHERIPL